MVEIVHPKKLDRSRPFGECLGGIRDGVHFTQGGYGFDNLGNCVMVTPGAPDYQEWLERRHAALQRELDGQQEPATPETDQDPANPNPEPEQAPSPPAGEATPPAPPPAQEAAPPASTGLTWGGPDPVTPAPPAEPAGESGDDDKADDTGPIDPDMDWNELQAAMKARNLPRPKNKEDAKRILEEAGLAA